MTEKETIKLLKKTERLDRRETNDVLSCIQKSKNRDIRNLFVEKNLGLVRKEMDNILKKYGMSGRYARKIFGIDEEDLFQEGVLGLMRSIESYNPLLGLMFCTYSCPWIRKYILRFLNGIRIIAVPECLGKTVRDVERFRNRYFGEKGEYPDAKIISESLGLPLKKVRDALSGDCRVSGKAVYPALTVCSAEETALKNSFGSGLLSDVKNVLDQRENRILLMRYRGGKTLKEIGRKENLSAERIRQILSAALEKLRNDETIASYR